jgi:hypothetical protein
MVSRPVIDQLSPSQSCLQFSLHQSAAGAAPPRTKATGPQRGGSLVELKLFAHSLAIARYGMESIAGSAVTATPCVMKRLGEWSTPR